MPHGSRGAQLSGRSGTGVVLASYGRGALVQSGEETLSCTLRGRKQRVVCGDRVHWVSGESDGGPAIDALEPRRNLLERIDARGRPEPVAANLDRLGRGRRLRAAPRLVRRRSLLGGRAAQGYRGAADRQQVGLEERGSRGGARQLPHARPALRRGIGARRRGPSGAARARSRTARRFWWANRASANPRW